MSNSPLPENHPLKGKKTGAWTKYGGARNGLEREKQPTWNCQGCGAEKPEALPGFMFEYSPSEYVRLCSKCQNLVKTEKIETYYTLTTIVRVKKQFY